MFALYSVACLQVYGPEASMTGICQHAIDYISSFDSNGKQ